MKEAVHALLCLGLCLGLGCFSPGSAGSKLAERAELAADDPLLDGGEHHDVYRLAARVGDAIVVDLRSPDFDPYLVLVSPSGEWFENDDHEGSATHSRLEVIAAESGEWQVYATSYDGGSLGRYELSATAEPSALPGRRFERGTLAAGDDVLDGGELADRLTFSAAAGSYVWIDLRSRDFDPYLVLLGPDGESWENDDHEASLDRSVLGATLPRAGEYEVVVTSSFGGETGAWDLTLRQDLSPAAFARVEEGALEAGDERLRSGEWVDAYSFAATGGQRLRAELSSEEFDTYLILVDPQGYHLENDEDGRGGSAIHTRLREPGVHRLLVSSYAPEETGRYRLSIDLAAPGAPPEVADLEIGDSRRGRLDGGDDILEQGELVDRYRFHAEAGTPVEVVVSSTQFDTYLMLAMPDGTTLDNDDDWEQSERSRLILTLPQGGDHLLAVSSYEAGEAGDYLLELRRPSGDRLPEVRGAARRSFALLVGVGDYGGRLSDLDNTEQDARQLLEALVRETGLRREDAVLLVGEEATVDRLRASLASLAARMTAADQLVFFFSGHGDRVRRERYQSADPDAVDEAISLYDAELVDDDFAALLDLVPGRVLVVLDSCFAGGFAKDAISAPGRMGLFSSEEDVTSQVAEKFRAGGFLSAFLVDALADGWADGGDGHLTALELSYYLHERYRNDVKGGGPDDFIRTDGPRLSHQRLVVDRGSINPADVLFTLRRAGR